MEKQSCPLTRLFIFFLAICCISSYCYCDVTLCVFLKYSIFFHSLHIKYLLESSSYLLESFSVDSLLQTFLLIPSFFFLLVFAFLLIRYLLLIPTRVLEVSPFSFLFLHPFPPVVVCFLLLKAPKICFYCRRILLQHFQICIPSCLLILCILRFIP